MYQKTILFLFASLLFALPACNNASTNEGDKSPETTAATTDFEGMANGLCECLRPLADMQGTVEALLAKQDTTALNAMLPELQEISSRTEACVQALEAKYGVVTGEDEAKADAAFSKVCPDIARMLSGQPGEME